MKVLAIIPARGDSIGITMKNIRNLAGRPLIKHTISSAKNSKLINKIVLSTDNHKIADMGKISGVEVPFIRPKKYLVLPLQVLIMLSTLYNFFLLINITHQTL